MSDVIYQTPLDWPVDWPRTLEPKRGNGRYTKKGSDGRNRPWSVSAAGDELARELKRLGASDCIITTDMVLRKDGLISGNQTYNVTPAISVFFKLDGRSLVAANDSFLEPANNIRQLTIALQNMRHLAENGGAVMKERVFRGFSALPAPIQMGEDCAVTLGLRRPFTRSGILSAYKRLAKQYHTDVHGGDGEKMKAINVARDSALAECA